ncbi:MAG: UPF0182 family protein [Corynebacterium sp.]|nr:UPF0182 family protein [Corynebacterium sp.]
MATGQFSRRSAGRPGKVIGIIVIILAIISIVGPLILNYYTNWLWFGEVDYRSVFNTIVLTRIGLFLVGAIVTAGALWGAGFWAYKTRPTDLQSLAGEGPLVEYKIALERVIRIILIIVPIIFGLFAGFMSQTMWQRVVLFFNRQSFGKTDPQFHLDYGFYAFTLPFLRTICEVLSLLGVLCFLAALITHYLLGGIRIGNRAAGVRGRISKAANVELGVIAGIWMVLRVCMYTLDRYDLLSTSNTTFDGGSYTTINAVLPAKIVLIVITALVAISFFSAVVIKDLRIPAMGTVLLIVSTIVIGHAWPMLLERFSVAPNRAEKESVYIARNIDATRYSFGLTDDKITYERNWGAQGATDASVSQDTATLSNIRILDPAILSTTFTQQQQLKNFYGFPDYLSMDRYVVDGQLNDYVIAARELDPNGLRDNQRDWINRHTVYTHGNGFIAAKASAVDEVARDAASARGGYPVYTVSDLQSMSRNANAENTAAAEKLGIEATQPRIYYGPVISSVPEGMDYAIVGNIGTPVEYDTDGSTFTYDGKGGVSIGNYLNRAVFAIKYQELNLLLSDRIGSESKIIFNRNPQERVSKVAPWLTTESTTYPAVIDGRIKWIVDGYTTLNSLPYAQKVNLGAAIEDSQTPDQSTGLGERVAYMRNSVKAVVDAYDGTVDLYAFDESDPVLKAWESVFPGVVKPKSEISQQLMDHLRYPADMFKVQRQIMTKYHVDDPKTFFTNDAFWSVPKDPNSALESTALNQPPYYVVAADPQNGHPSFQLISPLQVLNREFLAAHMSVSSDPESYGHITVRVLPTDTQTPGPKQAQDNMMSSDQISRDRALWEASNDLRNGNLLTLPVGNGEILYVEPMYAQRKGQESAFPKLLRVLIYYKGKIGYAPTIAEALSQVGIDPSAAPDMQAAIQSGGTTATVAPSTTTDNGGASAGTSSGTVSSGNTSVDQAIAAVTAAMNALDAAKNSSHEAYGKALDQLDAAMAQYRAAVAAAGSTSTSETAPAH